MYKFQDYVESAMLQALWTLSVTLEHAAPLILHLSVTSR